ncbi:uridylate-specific endoribonuclease B-like [Diadema antillarum]|uniref:uridylate-specific endoribonuclease B-like n=1 Tax=Diadema antillarum TaxID=105358 RepID=UPI003A860BF5
MTWLLYAGWLMFGILAIDDPSGAAVRTIPKLIPVTSPLEPLQLPQNPACQRVSRLGIPRGYRICRKPDCYSGPCVHGSCEETISSYICHCSPGFDGTDCGSGDILSDFVQSLWEADSNRLDGPDLVINSQNYLDDSAQLTPTKAVPSTSLFNYVNETKLTGTWPSFFALLDNYFRLTGTMETMPVRERIEIDEFITEVFATPIMNLTYEFLVDNGMQKQGLHLVHAVFPQPSNGTTVDSSGFERTFVGEVVNGMVSGYHNWLAFYLDEKEGRITYHGYIAEREPHQMQISFSLHGGTLEYEATSSIIFGVSAEFELAVYTVCFLLNPDGVSTFTLQGRTQRVQSESQEDRFISSTHFEMET